MEKQLIEDVIDWDVVNWSKAIDFWSKNSDITSKENNCLELGGRKGGLSLWLAVNGNRVICSDLDSPEKYASALHLKYNCSEKIEYSAIDATQIPYEDHFDVIVFKSILGGISRNNNDKLKQQTIDQIFKALKPSGKLLFAENLEASSMHRFLRRRFIKWGGDWNYLRFKEIDPLFKSFNNLRYETAGFFGTFGRTESQRRFFGKIDSIFRPIIPKNRRYIVYGVAEKHANES